MNEENAIKEAAEEAEFCAKDDVKCHFLLAAQECCRLASELIGAAKATECESCGGWREVRFNALGFAGDLKDVEREISVALCIAEMREKVQRQAVQEFVDKFIADFNGKSNKEQAK